MRGREMNVRREMCYSKWVIVAAVASILTTASSARLDAVGGGNETRISLPGCPEKCGNLSIPYPFGVGIECSYGHGFNITCNQTAAPPFAVPIIGENFKVQNISLLEGKVRLPSSVAYACYDHSGQVLPNKSLSTWSCSGHTFSILDNVFVVTGCDATAQMVISTSGGRGYSTQCWTNCDNMSTTDDIGACSGDMGCCQVQIPNYEVHYINISVRSRDNYTKTREGYKRCSYGYLIAKDSFNFSLTNLTTSSEMIPTDVPVVYDWIIGTENCTHAQASGSCLCCNNTSSQCLDTKTLRGYRCACSPGYSGNPYLSGGCGDVDECKQQNNCLKPAVCVNTKGSYYCQCPRGFKGKGTISSPCISKQTTIKIIVGLSTALGTIILLLGGSWLKVVIKRMRVVKQKVKYFEQNGGLLLQQKLSYDGAGVEGTRIFAADELEEATNHFSEDQILGQGGQGTVYKGMLRGGRIVAIKKAKEVDESRRGEFINEVILLSQINHRNIVKLLGCCLEVEVPLLVYEFIPNGTLYQHIHNPNEEFPITWKMRLQIAYDSASALAYLHFSSSIPIFHRDIKSSNILLDDKYRAKLSDFGTSRSVAVDQTHLTTRVLGTFGYMDPEYFQSSQFTEKSDVYSFGVVLVEILTGEKAIRSTTQKEKSLISWFFAHMEDNTLFDVVDSQVLQEGSKQELLMLANLAKQCLNIDGRGRPSMPQVAAKIEDIKSLEMGRTNPQDELKTKHTLAEQTQRIHQTISSLNISTSFSEIRSQDSTEVSLLFDTTS